MRYTHLVLTLTTACGSYFEAPDTAQPQCVPPGDAGIGIVTVVLELPSLPTLPVASDLVVRGHLTSLFGVTVSKVLVAGIPATHDSADFSAFDVTVPIGVLQAEAASVGSPALANLAITVISNCSAEPVMVQTLPVRLRAITELTLALEPPDHGYVPSSIQRPAVLDLDANPEAAGLPLTLSSSQGTPIGPAILPGDGVQRVTTKLYLIPDPAKQGLAQVIAQSGARSGAASVLIVGPPALVPPSASITRGGPEFEVFVSNLLPSTSIAASIVGCTAGATSGIAVHVGPDDISGQGLTPLSAEDPAHHPLFRIAALPTATAMSSVSVTCFDVHGQSATGTYTAL